MSLSDIWVIFSVLCYRNINCGKLVCHWTHADVMPFKDFDIQYTYFQGIVCASAYLRRNTGESLKRDYTYVSTGTMCGENNVNKKFS